MWSLLVLLASLPLAQAQGAIGFQIHSQNDLRQWPQTLSKGATWFKVDPNYVPKGGHPNCVTSGCLLLSHDNPVPSRLSYNTTDDLIEMLASFSNFSTPIRIALCFKYNDALPCADKEWLALADKFFLGVNETIVKNNISVELLLDGDATATGRPCLKNRWRPWNATWVIGRDPAQAALDNNDATGNDAYQVNNMPVGSLSDPASNLRAMQDLAPPFGKFNNASSTSYPFLFWEPSDEASIRTVLNSFRTGPPSPQEFRFAINIDPIQFSNYAGLTAQSQIPWNGPSVATNVLLGEDGTTVVAFANGSIAYARPNQLHGLALLLLENVHLTPLVVANMTSLQVLPNSTWVLGDVFGHLALYDVSDITPHLVYIDYVIPASDSAAVAVSYVAAANATFTRILAWLTANGSLCVGVERGGAAGCTADAWQPSPGFTSLALTVFSGGSDESNVTAIAAFVCPATTTVHLGVAVLSLMGGRAALWLGNGPGVIGVGTHVGRPAASSSQIALVMGDAFCFNSADHNRDAEPATCDLVPVSTPLILAYATGTLSAWIALLSSGSLATACSTGGVLAGMFQAGLFPAAALRYQPTSSSLELTTAFVGVPTSVGQPAPESVACGLPIAFDGLRHAAWAI